MPIEVDSGSFQSLALAKGSLELFRKGQCWDEFCKVTILLS